MKDFEMKMKKSAGKFLVCQIVLLVILGISIVMLAILIIFKDEINNYFQNMIFEQEKLTKGSALYEAWMKSSDQVYLEIYMFNVTNADEFLNGEAKLNVEEIGPFIYKQNNIKSNLSWNSDQTELTYYENTTFKFVREKSVMSDEEANITSVNLVVIGLSGKVQELKYKWEEWVISKIINFLNKERVFISKSVKDILWGYEDPLLVKLEKLAKYIKVEAPPTVVALKTNGSTESLRSIIGTGVVNASDLNQFKMWNNLTTLDKWGTPYARRLYGTDGHLFHPNVSRSDNVTAYISQIYRSGYFSYIEDTSLFGIHAFRFGIPKEELENSTVNPSNVGFYSFGLSGTMNLTVYAPLNLPVFVTKPHFLDTDPIALEYITGLSPNRTLHDSKIDIEPITGLVINAAKRLQFNIELQSSNTIESMQFLTNNILCPIYWASETGGMSENQAEEMKDTLFLFLNGVQTGIWILMGFFTGVAIITLLCSIPITLLLIRRICNKNGMYNEEWVYQPLLS